MGSIGGFSPEGSVALGIVAGLVSTSVQSLGLTLQRKSHILEDEKGPYDVRRPPYRRRRWQLGMGMFVIANVFGSSVQISTLPLPVLSTLQASGLVFNSVCATLILGEPFTTWSLWGTMLVCAGAVLIAVFGAIPSPAHKLSELLELLAQRPFVLWMSFQAVLAIGVALAAELLNKVPRFTQNARFRLARGFAYGCISGILSAHSLLVAKSAVELIVRTIADGDNQFVHWPSWMLVLGLVTLAISQLYYLHRGLKLVSTSVLYPLIFCIYNIIAILDGLIYFRQAGLIGLIRGCLIALGTVILLSGVLALSWRLSEKQHPPGVGQSSLAPGLGFVEDTEGEEEEEELLLGSTLGDEDDEEASTSTVQPPLQRSYKTFGSGLTLQTGAIDAAAEEDTNAVPPFTSQRRTKSHAISRESTRKWAERAEIWEALEDRDAPESSLPPSVGATGRRRSNTIPANDSRSLLCQRRRTVRGFQTSDNGANTSSNQPMVGSSSTLPHQAFGRRRKSTGFSGFTPRKARRKSSAHGFQDALGEIWRGRWWKDKARGVVWDDSSSRQGSGSGATWLPYCGDLEAGGEIEQDPDLGEGGQGPGSDDYGASGATPCPPMPPPQKHGASDSNV